MASIVCAHVAETKNIGDLASAPYRYFDFGDVNVVDIRKPIPASDVLIFGGGALGRRLAIDRTKAKVKIAWGVGFTLRGVKNPPQAPAGFTLYGSREWNQPGAIYAPCASCMAPEFYQIRPAPEYGVVAYLNADKNVRARFKGNVQGVPVKYNTCGFAEALDFLASGDAVVTDSYHGAYWATLLARRVICLPYSSKFWSFQFPPTMAEDGDWNMVLPKARNYAQALAVARNKTEAFYERVADAMVS